MCGRSESAHVDADFGDDDVSAEVLDAGNRHYEVDCGAKGPKVRLHLRVDRGHGGIESVDLIEMKAQQKAMVLRHAAAKGPRACASEVRPAGQPGSDTRWGCRFHCFSTFLVSTFQRLRAKRVTRTRRLRDTRIGPRTRRLTRWPRLPGVVALLGRGGYRTDAVTLAGAWKSFGPTAAAGAKARDSVSWALWVTGPSATCAPMACGRSRCRPS
jgi:hypothetical protein